MNHSPHPRFTDVDTEAQTEHANKSQDLNLRVRRRIRELMRSFESSG